MLTLFQPLVIPLDGPSHSTSLDIESSPLPASNTPGRYRSITEYHALYSSGELTPLAVVESLLPVIRRDVDQPSNHSIAFIDTHTEAVLEAAKASTIRYREGKPLGSRSRRSS